MAANIPSGGKRRRDSVFLNYNSRCADEQNERRRGRFLLVRRAKIQGVLLHLGKPPLPEDQRALPGFPPLPARFCPRAGKVFVFHVVCLLCCWRWDERERRQTKTEYQAARMFPKQLHLHAGSGGGGAWGGCNLWCCTDSSALPHYKLPHQ